MATATEAAVLMRLRTGHVQVIGDYPAAYDDAFGLDKAKDVVIRLIEKGRATQTPQSRGGKGTAYFLLQLSKREVIRREILKILAQGSVEVDTYGAFARTVRINGTMREINSALSSLIREEHICVRRPQPESTSSGYQPITYSLVR